MTGQNEEKLSVRLTAEAQFRSRSGDFAAWVPESDKALAALLTEAAHFVRLVEEAPVGQAVGQSGPLPGYAAAIVLMDDPASIKGQRVRLVREG